MTFDSMDTNKELHIAQGSVNSGEIANLLSENFEQYFSSQKAQGRDFYLALKRNDDLDGIQRKCDSLDSVGYKSFNTILASINRFDYLLDASDDEVEKAYYGYFEPQKSEFYLGTLSAALEYAAFREGFYETKVDKSMQGLSDSLLNAVKIAEKMTEIQKRLSSKS